MEIFEVNPWTPRLSLNLIQTYKAGRWWKYNSSCKWWGSRNKWTGACRSGVLTLWKS